jgi:hypothetical protein
MLIIRSTVVVIAIFINPKWTAQMFGDEETATILRWSCTNFGFRCDDIVVLVT